MVKGMKHSIENEKQYFTDLKQSVTLDGKLLYAGRLLKRAADQYGDLRVIIYNDQEITYKQLYHRVCAFAKVLKQKGVKPKDRVIICFENSPEFYIAYYAVWQSGAVVAPINTFLKEKELGHIIQESKQVGLHSYIFLEAQGVLDQKRVLRLCDEEPAFFECH